MPPWRWSDSLDALVAAPAHHSLLLENDFVRVLDTRVAAGDTVPLHTHRWPAVLHVVTWSDCVRRDEHGAVLLDSRDLQEAVPSIMWSAPLPPHTLENVGSTDIRVLSIELKQGAR